MAESSRAGAAQPGVDLARVLDEHLRDEFDLHDVEATMKTMVPDPYVNHVAVMTGGVGYAEVHRFYKHHFIPKWPKDTKAVRVSRTIGVDQVVDEVIMSFTHDMEMDFIIPGVPPTGKRVEFPVVVVAAFRDGKLAHEHIYWDQATILVQVGLLDPGGLPVTGVEQARKVLDKTLPSNTLMKRWAASAP
jgi:carboxymethylenebutenolidase